jgi:hypothetical protein
MIEPVRICADYFADGTTGVNALLAAVDLDTGDTVPPDLAQVLDDTRYGVVARRRWNASLETAPSLLVYDAGAQWQAPHVGKQDGTARVGVYYLVEDSDSAAGVEDAHYTLRAVRQAVSDLAGATSAARTRNGIIVTDLQTVEDMPADVEIDGVLIAGAMRITWRVRDTAP